jgi:hypothetical protein
MALISGGSNLLGSILAGGAQGEMSEAQIRAALQELGLDEAKFSEMLRQAQGKAAVEGIQETPNRVGWRQNQALAAAIMPNVRNVSVSSPIPGMNRFIPQIGGGVRIPEGGFGPDTLKFFGEKAMLAGETDLDKAVSTASEGRLPTPDYSAVYGTPGTAAAASVESVSSRLRKDAAEREKKRREAIERALRGSGGYTGTWDGPTDTL